MFSVRCLEFDCSHTLHFDHAICLFFVYHSYYKVWWIIAYVNIASPQLLYVVVNLDSILMYAIYRKPFFCPGHELLIGGVWSQKRFSVWSVYQIIPQVCAFQ